MMHPATVVHCLKSRQRVPVRNYRLHRHSLGIICRALP